METNKKHEEPKEPTFEDMGFTVIDMGTDRLGDERNWNIERETGYKPLTTFYADLALADCFGPLAVVDMVVRLAKDNKNDAKRITELSMVLNHRGWMHHHAKRAAYSKVYFAAWEWLTDKIENEWLTGDDLSYYFATTD